MEVNIYATAIYISLVHAMLSSNLVYKYHVQLITSADDKPVLNDLLHMSYTGEDGRDVHFRLMDQLKPYWKRFAIALKFPQHEIAVMKQEDDPVFYLISEWLRGANQEVDSRPVTWRTLIEALQCANVQEEATILKRHFISPNAAAGEYTCHAAYSVARLVCM